MSAPHILTKFAPGIPKVVSQLETILSSKAKYGYILAPPLATLLGTIWHHFEMNLSHIVTDIARKHYQRNKEMTAEANAETIAR